MSPTRDELLEPFLQLVRIPSPSGHERAVADLVLARLRAAGLEPVEGEPVGIVGEAAGPIHVVIAGQGCGTPILLCAHLDTVAVEGPIEPVVADGVVRSDGSTILGADDKTAVTVLLAALEEFALRPPSGRVEALFTPSEEVGLLGAKAFDPSGTAAAAGFVLDSSGPLGDVIVAAPAQRTVTAEFKGQAAHAGIEPERGRSAVVAAARAVTSMQLGRLDEVTTANIGIIEGGVATNIVPERCVIRGEARSRDAARLTAQVRHMLDAVALAAAQTDVDVTSTVTEEYQAFSLSEESLPARIAAAAVRSLGLEPRFRGTGGGSDVNVFNTRGLPSVNLSAGYEQVHSSSEYMPIERLEQAYALVLALVEAAGSTSPA